MPLNGERSQHGACDQREMATMAGLRLAHFVLARLRDAPIRDDTRQPNRHAAASPANISVAASIFIRPLGRGEAAMIASAVMWRPTALVWCPGLGTGGNSRLSSTTEATALPKSRKIRRPMTIA